MKKSYLKNTYLLYTCSFLLLLPFVFLPFITKGKSFVWSMDGISQHYPMITYYGNLLKGVLSGKGFPMMDFKLGLGFDTITTLNYYVLGDPITLLSILINQKNAVFIYDALILLRFYLAGISFIIFMKYWKKDGLGVVLGALIYTFCGYSLYAGVRHPFFLNPMIYLPLILIGLEQVLRRKKPYLLIIMAFIGTISNFYFFYVLTVIIVIYVIYRYFVCYRKSYKNAFTGLLITGFRTGGYYLLGMAMAAAIFLPVLYAFSQNGRLDSKPKLINGFLFYNKEYYLSIFQGIFASGMSPGYWVNLSFSSIAMVSLIILWCNKKYLKLRWVLLVSFCALLVPAFGYFMNGFSYVANRWDFLISLLVAVVFAVTYEKLFELGKREKILLAAATAVYGILAFAFPSEKIVKQEFLVLLITVIVVFLLQLKWFESRKLLREAGTFALVFLTLAFNGFAYYSPQYYGYVSEFLTKSKVVDLSSGKGALSLIPDIADNSLYRIETYGDTALNESLTVGFNDVSGYFSLMDGDITNYFKNLELLNQRTAYRFDNLDNRTILDTLSGVKYFVTTDKSAAPYGYQLLKEENNGAKTYYLFQNLNALPLGYTYQNYMLVSDYNKLSSLEKQNALMNAVILNQDSNYANKTNQNVDQGIEKLNAGITTNNVELGVDSIKVDKAGATIILTFNAKPNTETYVRFGNLNISKDIKSMTDFSVKADNGADKEVNVKSMYYNSYFGKENYLINTGYSETGQTRVTITFPQKETYTYNSLDVYSLDMSNYQTQFTALNQSVLQNIQQKNNSVQGDITLNQKGIMALSIPYSKGWSAYVDGKKTDLLPADVMNMALPLEAGSHHIVIKYVTPLLKEGSFISLIAFLIFIGMILYNKAADKKNLLILDKKERD